MITQTIILLSQSKRSGWICWHWPTPWMVCADIWFPCEIIGSGNEEIFFSPVWSENLTSYWNKENPFVSACIPDTNICICIRVHIRIRYCIRYTLYQYHYTTDHITVNYCILHIILLHQHTMLCPYPYTVSRIQIRIQIFLYPLCYYKVFFLHSSP